MIETRPLPLWAGRTVALVGILLVALTLRLAVAALSPILGSVDADIPLSSVAIGVIGMLPPILFAASGFVAPPIARRIGLERAIVLAIGLMVVGHLARAFAPSYAVLVVGSGVALLGMGMGNILLPPAVKRYFPDRIGLLTSAYAAILAVSAALPALVAAPIADSLGWRQSLGVWALVAGISVFPWIMLAVRHSRETAAALAGEAPVEAIPQSLLGSMWRSRTAWAIAFAFAVTALNTYALFAWLPEVLVGLTHMGHTDAGLLLSIYSIAGLPGSIIAPLLVARMRNVSWIILAGVVFFVLGYVGLLLRPGNGTLLWVILAGIGPILFPVCLVLINARSRSHAGSIALSGFVQGIGYTVGALGPLAIAVLHEATGGWTAPLTFLLVTMVVAIVSAIALARPRFVEDEIDASRARSAR